MIMRSTGGEKRSVTVVLTAVADGHILPLIVVFQGKRELKVTALLVCAGYGDLGGLPTDRFSDFLGNGSVNQWHGIISSQVHGSTEVRSD